MGRWRIPVLILGLLAFGLAAAGSTEIGSGWAILSGVSRQVGPMAFFWLGVVCCLAAVWGRPGT